MLANARSGAPTAPRQVLADDGRHHEHLLPVKNVYSLAPRLADHPHLPALKRPPMAQRWIDRRGAGTPNAYHREVCQRYRERRYTLATDRAKVTPSLPPTPNPGRQTMTRGGCPTVDLDVP